MTESESEPKYVLDLLPKATFAGVSDVYKNEPKFLWWHLYVVHNATLSAVLRFVSSRQLKWAFVDNLTSTSFVLKNLQHSLLVDPELDNREGKVKEESCFSDAGGWVVRDSYTPCIMSEAERTLLACGEHFIHFSGYMQRQLVAEALEELETLGEPKIVLSLGTLVTCRCERIKRKREITE